MRTKRMTFVSGLHLAFLLLAVFAVTAYADPGPTNTTGCCDLVKNDCEGCVKLTSLVFGTDQYWVKIDKNPYTRCGTTGFSPDGCKEMVRNCYKSVNRVLLYGPGCAAELAYGGNVYVDMPQCPDNINSGENPCLNDSQ